MKFFLTGATGILGSAIMALLIEKGEQFYGVGSTDINLSALDDVRKVIVGYEPRIIIHCAALTNVDLCEDEKDLAHRINVNGTENVANVASEIGAKLVYISSCGVYGDSKSDPHKETDELDPLNYHHFTKLQGERIVQSYCENHLIIRPGWLFGGTLEHKKNFVEGRRKEALHNSIIKSASDKYGSPTYTADLARQIIFLLDQHVTGIFNVVNEGCASRYEYVTAIIKGLSLTNVVEPVNSNSFPRRALMPNNECLENFNLNALGLNKMRNWRTAIEEYIKLTYHK